MCNARDNKTVEFHNRLGYPHQPILGVHLGKYIRISTLDECV